VACVCRLPDPWNIDTTTGSGDKLPLSVYSTNTIAGGASFEVDDCNLTQG